MRIVRVVGCPVAWADSTTLVHRCTHGDAASTMAAGAMLPLFLKFDAGYEQATFVGDFLTGRSLQIGGTFA